MSVLEISAADYHADRVGDQPTLSSSLAKILIGQSPLHAWHAHPKLNPAYERTVDKKFDLGVACHALLLEGRDAVEPIAMPNWTTKEARALGDEARAGGRIPMLLDQWASVQEMCAAVNAQLDEYEIAPRPFTDGQPEQTLLWDDRGVQCRARLDWLREDCSHVFDLKTTSRAGGANPKLFERAIFSLGYDLQAAFYLRGLRAVKHATHEFLTGVDPAWRWVVAETMPPYAVTVVQPDDDTIAIGNAKVERALEVWAECLATDCWPAYSTTVETASAPAWETAWLLTPELEETAWTQF